MSRRKVLVLEKAGELRPSGPGRLSEKLVKRLWTSMVPLVLLLAACEGEGNAGDDNLLTGGSLIIVVIIVVIVAVLLLRRRR
ncbi:MAG: hypothetical protein ACXWZF_10295 [Actinomycetota bacterium]